MSAKGRSAFTLMGVDERRELGGQASPRSVRSVWREPAFCAGDLLGTIENALELPLHKNDCMPLPERHQTAYV
jgi:hypothetical protein